MRHCEAAVCGQQGFALDAILTDPLVAVIFVVPILVGIVVIVGYKWP